MKLIYCANIRLPTEKAHGLQIMQNCEAFAANGTAVTLLVARRRNTAAMAQVRDVYAHYGVTPAFGIRWLPCLDLFRFERYLGPLAFAVQAATYTLVLMLRLLFTRADAYYTRDLLTVLALTLIKPRRRIAYEVHQRSKSRLGRWAQRLGARRAGLVVAITGRLAAEMRDLGAAEGMVAHDGYRAARFAHMPDPAHARQHLNLPTEAFMVGYVGRLQTLGASKGGDTLVAAVARAGRAITLCLVGGPANIAESLRAQWAAAGLSADRFYFAGQVPPGHIPSYLAAFDVCAMPFPWTDHFAYYASPLKLFEYMAAGRAILSSDLPTVREVVHDGESALLVPPGDAEALAAALCRLYDDPALRARIAEGAKQAAPHYTWEARAAQILTRLVTIINRD